MADVKFYLEKRKDKATGEPVTTNVPILLFFSFSGQRLQYYTGLRTDAHKWDEAQFKAKRNYSESAEINKELDRLKTKVHDLYDRAKALSLPLSTRYFRDGLNDTKPVVLKSYSFEECFEEFIENARLHKSYGTLRNIRSTLTVLKDFSKKSGIRLDFASIDEEFYNRFLEYCFEERGARNNYAGNLIKHLKAFLNYATDRGYNTNLTYKKKFFKKLTEEPEIIFLTYEELMHFHSFPFSEERHAQVRDIFCFGCFTGMRYSDIKALQPENIHAEFITYRVVKTGENNTIPLNQYSRTILEKYKGHPLKALPVPSQAIINTWLREAASEAKLYRSIQQTHFQGSKRISNSLALCEAISFHVSKKTFMTNFLAKGGSLLTAMSITGNKDMKTARRYFKVVDTLKADEMKKVFG